MIKYAKGDFEMSQILTLNISFEYDGICHEIHPVVLKNNEELILVDCGYPEFFDLISDELENNGISAKDLTAIYITHQDDDHMGTAAEFKSRYPHIKIITSETEAPYISGNSKNLRLRQAEEMLEILPDEQKDFGIAFCERLNKLNCVQVDQTANEGDLFNWASGCEIIATPGHTPGHTSLYIKEQKTIITGDACVIENDELVVANPHFCLDFENAQKSLEKIKNMEVETYICYHGGILKRQITDFNYSNKDYH